MTLDDFLDWIAKHPKEWAEYQKKLVAILTYAIIALPFSYIGRPKEKHLVGC